MSANPDSCSAELGRVLVIGVSGIHGWPIFKLLAEELDPDQLMGVRPPRAKAPVHDRVVSNCLSDRAGLLKLRDLHRPDTVIHAGGVCDLDLCQIRPDLAQSLNVEGTQHVLDVFSNTRLLYISTDLVFSGRKPPAGGYRESDAIDPISVVGESFAEAEKKVMARDDAAVVRLALPIGASAKGTAGAVDWILGRFRRGLVATLFHDELRSVIACEELARWIVELLRSNASGLFHLGGPRGWSLFEIGQKLMDLGGFDPALLCRSSRLAEINGPPRVGDVSMCCAHIEKTLGRSIAAVDWDRVL